MKRIHVSRLSTDAQGTVGRVAVGASHWPLLELPWRDNQRGKSCVVAGVYRAQLYQSPKFGQVIWVRAVPQRSGILFHAGNVAGDAAQGWMTHSLGCPLPGSRTGRLVVAGRAQRAVLSSKMAMRQILAAVAGLVGKDKHFEVEFVWAVA